MFATLAGGYPRPDLGQDATPDDLVRAVIAEQEAAGLEILSDGDVRWDDRISAIAGRLEGLEIEGLAPYLETGRLYRQPRATREPRWDGPIFVTAWQFAASCTTLPVKQAIVGPYTLASLAAPGAVGRERLTMVLADVLGHEIRALIEAGCPVVQVDEDAAVRIGGSEREQQLFQSAQRRLTHGLPDAHLSLAITGGSAVAIPARVLYDAPYRSYLLDLVASPDNWRLVPSAPVERGIICGVGDARTGAPDDPERLAWAATYAASIRQRGPDRIGLAPSGSLAGLSLAEARAKIELLAEVAAETHARAAAAPDTLDPEKLTIEGLARGWLGNTSSGTHA